MPPRSPFRVVPPLALVAVLVAVWLLVAPGSDEPSERPVAGPTTTTTAPRTTRRTYTVRPGDNLTSVAARYGLDVAQLVELNPQVDPQALRAGQRIRLRPRD
jgi:LysM repeat protein